VVLRHVTPPSTVSAAGVVADFGIVSPKNGSVGEAHELPLNIEIQPPADTPTQNVDDWHVSSTALSGPLLETGSDAKGLIAVDQLPLLYVEK
jgi:hypothetical protein